MIEKNIEEFWITVGNLKLLSEYYVATFFIQDKSENMFFIISAFLRYISFLRGSKLLRKKVIEMLLFIEDKMFRTGIFLLILSRSLAGVLKG